MEISNNNNKNQTKVVLPLTEETPKVTKRKSRAPSDKKRNPRVPPSLMVYSRNKGNLLGKEEELNNELLKIGSAFHNGMESQVADYLKLLNTREKAIIHGFMTAISFPNPGKTSEELINMVHGETKTKKTSPSSSFSSSSSNFEPFENTSPFFTTTTNNNNNMNNREKPSLNVFVMPSQRPKFSESSSKVEEIREENDDVVYQRSEKKNSLNSNSVTSSTSSMSETKPSSPFSFFDDLSSDNSSNSDSESEIDEEEQENEKELKPTAKSQKFVESKPLHQSTETKNKVIVSSKYFPPTTITNLPSSSMGALVKTTSCQFRLGCGGQGKHFQTFNGKSICQTCCLIKEFENC